MLDIKFLRTNPDIVKQNIKNKFQDEKLPLVDQVIELDKEFRESKTRAEALRANRNKVSKQIGALMAQGKKDEAEVVKKQVTDMADELEARGGSVDAEKLSARLSLTAKMLWGLYALLTFVLILLLWCGPMTFFDSVCHAFSCISTGGYSTQNESIAAFHSPYIKVVLMLFMFIGGTSFGLIIVGLKSSVREIWRNDVFRAYLGAVLVYYALMVFAIVYRGHYTGWESVTIDPLFHIISAMTSTGFSAGNWEGWGILVLTLTFFMMYVGACAGSTTGGAKFDRLLYLVKNFRSVVRKYVRPRLVTSVDVNGQYINSERSNEISAFIFIYTLLIIFGGVVLVVHGFPIVDAFFSSVSCISNNGLGAGVTGVTGSYDFLPPSGMWVMSVLMLAGRLEIFTLIAILSPSFWRNSINKSKI